MHTLAGKVGRMKINDSIRLSRITPEDKNAWSELRRAHHAQVDWALDISAAKPLRLEISGIPAAKIRRNPETQIVVTKERLDDKRQIDATPGLDEDLRFMLESFVVGDASDRVFVAPTGRAPRQFKRYLEGFALLRRAGLAEPD